MARTTPIGTAAAKRRVIELVATILTTLNEMSGMLTGTPKSAPDGHIYAGLMSVGVDFDQYIRIRQYCIKMGWCKLSNHILSLTDDGVALAEKIEAELKN